MVDQVSIEDSSHAMKDGIRASDGENSGDRKSSPLAQSPPTTTGSPEEKPPSPNNIRDNHDTKREGEQEDNSAASSNSGAFSPVDPQLGQPRRRSQDLWAMMNQFRYSCGMLVNHSKAQFLIIVLISINAILMGVSTFDIVKKNPTAAEAFEFVDTIFLFLFTVELGLQFVYHGWRLFLDGWLVFDTTIIVVSWTFSSVQVIRAFRIFRSLRLITRIKIMKNLILALFGVMPRMAAIGLLLALIFYIFAVMFTQLFKDMFEDGQTDFNYFSGIDWTLFTLFQIMTLDNWATIARQVMEVYPWAWLPFVAFVIICGFIVVNLIIAVICDAISALHKDDKAKLEGIYAESDSTPSAPVEIREQLDSLEEQMVALTRIQASTFHTLQYMTRQIEMQKLKQELQSKGVMRTRQAGSQSS